MRTGNAIGQIDVSSFFRNAVLPDEEEDSRGDWSWLGSDRGSRRAGGAWGRVRDHL